MCWLRRLLWRETIGGMIIIVLYELPRASINSVSIGVIGITNDYLFHGLR